MYGSTGELTTERAVLISLHDLHLETNTWVSTQAVAQSTNSYTLAYSDYARLLSELEDKGIVYASVNGWVPRSGVAVKCTFRKYCDLCKRDGNYEVEAVTDARTFGGRWGNLCAEHFIDEGCEIGLGRGQFVYTDEDLLPAELSTTQAIKLEWEAGRNV